MTFRIYNLQRSSAGYWQASVSINGARGIEVNTRHGSWQTVADADGRFKDLPFEIASELQRQVYKREHPRPGARKENRETRSAVS